MPWSNIQGFLLRKESNMRIKGLRNTVSQNQLVSVLKRHLTKDQAQLVALAKQILNGVVIVLEDDWALEQDLKDLGVKVD